MQETIVALSYLLTTSSNKAYIQVIVYLQKGFEKPANDGTIRNPSFLLSKAVIG
jgi:hypothetical protein